MDSNLKNFFIKFGVVIGTVVLVASVYFGGKAILESRAETKRQQAQVVIREMITFCGFSKLSDEEQTAITKCGDDVEAVRFKLKQIVDDRIIYWKSRIGNLVEAIQKVQDVKTRAFSWSVVDETQYRQVMSKLLEEGKIASDQLQNWTKKKKDLDDWTPFDNQKSGSPSPKIRYL